MASCRFTPSRGSPPWACSACSRATAPKKAVVPKTAAAAAGEGADKLCEAGPVEQIGTRTILSRTQAASVVALKSGKTVGLPGLGTLSVRATAARQGVRPGTREEITIAAGKKVRYKVALDPKKSF